MKRNTDQKNLLMNHEGVCRTAMATPCLLIITQLFFVNAQPSTLGYKKNATETTFRWCGLLDLVFSFTPRACEYTEKVG